MAPRPEITVRPLQKEKLMASFVPLATRLVGVTLHFQQVGCELGGFPRGERDDWDFENSSRRKMGRPPEIGAQ